MDTHIRRLVAAGAVAGFLTIGGMSLASAQDDPTTTTTAEDTTTTAEDTTTTAVDDSDSTSDDSSTSDASTDEDCPKDAAEADTDATAESGS